MAYRAKDFQLAISKYHLAISSHPMSTIYSNKGLVLYAMNKKFSALECLREGLKIDNNCANIKANMPRLE